MARSRTGSCFERAILQSSLNAVHRDEDAAANAHDADSFLGDAVVDGADTHAQRLRGLHLRKGHWASAFGFLDRLRAGKRPRREGPFDFLADGRANGLKQRLEEFFQRENLAVLVELQDEFDGHELFIPNASRKRVPGPRLFVRVGSACLSESSSPSRSRNEVIHVAEEGLEEVRRQSS